MIKPTVRLDVACKRGVESLSQRNNPVEDRTLEPFGVIRPSTRNALLNLESHEQYAIMKRIFTAHQFGDLDDFRFFQIIHETIFKAWNHENKRPKYTVLTSLPAK